MKYAISVTIALLLLSIFIYPVAADGQSTETMAQHDPVLDEIMNSSEPSTVAERHGVTYENGSVLVVVELGEDEQLPEGYDVEVRQRFEGAGENLVEGYVPIESIRGLSSEPSVEYIRVPAEAQPSQEDETSESPQEETDTDSEDTDEEPQEQNGFTFLMAVASLTLLGVVHRYV